MGYGLSILLLAVGAILAFAVRTATFGGVDIHIVGWILMAAGVLGLIWSLVLTTSRRRVLVDQREDIGTRVVERDVPTDQVIRRQTP